MCEMSKPRESTRPSDVLPALGLLLAVSLPVIGLLGTLSALGVAAALAFRNRRRAAAAVAMAAVVVLVAVAALTAPGHTGGLLHN
jgi:ABC-type Na+ efflux pump permease subunit